MEKKLIYQIIKFGIVGGLAFIVDAGILYILTRGFGVYYLLSASISFTVSLIFNYILSMKFVFIKKQELSRRREFAIFAVLSVIGLLLNDFIMWVGVDFVNLHFMLTKVIATAIVMVWNFVSKKFYLENQSR